MKKKGFLRQSSSRINIGSLNQTLFDQLLQQQTEMERQQIDILDILLKPNEPNCAKVLRKFQGSHQQIQIQGSNDLNSISSELLNHNILYFEALLTVHNKKKRISAQIIQNLPDLQQKFSFHQGNLIILLDDITKKRNYQEIQKRLRFQHQLILSFSHELKTPLNGSIQSLSLALQICNDQSLIEECIKPAYTSNILLMYQINDILDFAAIQSLNFSYNQSKFTFFEIANEILDIFQQPCKLKQITLKLDICSLSVPITSDKQRILQVIVNLMNNSIRFAPQGGKIEIIMKLSSNKFSVDEWFKIIVRDNGPGLEAKKMEHIQQFLIDQNQATSYDVINFNENSDEKLIGLGFKISNRLVSGLKGAKSLNYLRLKQAKPTGLQVSFYLKIMNETKNFKRFDTFQKQLISLQSIVSESCSSQFINSNDSIQQLKQIKINPMMLEKKQSVRTYGAQTELAVITEERQSIKQCCAQVLIADDEPFNQIPLKGLLAQFHLISDAAYNGLEALNKIQQKYLQTCCNKNYYQLIFMDLQMPVMDGLQAIKEIQVFLLKNNIKEEERAKIIVCSAFDTLKNINDATRFGATEFLPKPVQKESLRQIVEKFINYY